MTLNATDKVTLVGNNKTLSNVSLTVVSTAATEFQNVILDNTLLVSNPDDAEAEKRVGVITVTGNGDITFTGTEVCSLGADALVLRASGLSVEFLGTANKILSGQRAVSILAPTTLTVNGGTFENDSESHLFYIGFSEEISGLDNTITVNGGTFNQKYSVTKDLSYGVFYFDAYQIETRVIVNDGTFESSAVNTFVKM